MNELQQNANFLTPIEVDLGVDENGMTTARKLYSFLELAQGQFSRWAKANITENEFATENEDWWGFDINVEGNIVKDYKLTAHFAKKLSLWQKKCVAAHYLNAKDWMLLEETEFYLKIINKYTNKTKNIDKFRR